MDIAEMTEDAERLMLANRVFAEPVTVDGTTIITAARVGGGGGSGSGPAEDGGQGEGNGGGLGFTGRPAGAYVIADGVVSWKPAVDVNRAVTVAGVVLVAALATVRALWARRGLGRRS
ncbi:sporulation protein [Pseudonocardia xishanensis]|uniref:Sporulation protein YtfJ n=1 Tax=Pseudonocardia xishanensis TaxID=630995 RepID=A0ABP8RRF8_9PSEU